MKELPSPTQPLLDLLHRRSITSSRPLRPALQTAPASISAPALEVVWARHQDEVRAAQRLRYSVFAVEHGARLQPPSGTPDAHDADRYDDYCEHLLVRTRATDDLAAAVIGTYRVLTPGGARRAGGCYSDTEFDLSSLRPLRQRMAELGRSCVHADHRTGGVILTLWSALAGFMDANGLDTVVGCASVGMRDGGHTAASLWAQLRQDHLAAPALQVRPHLALPVDELDQTLAVEPPALIKGYLRCGAEVLGPPAWDPDFNTADLPMLLQLARLHSRYRRHFMGDA